MPQPPADPVAKLAAVVRRLEKKEAAFLDTDAEVAGLLRHRVGELEDQIAATVATSTRGVLAQIRLIGREHVPEAPWFRREMAGLLSKIARDGLTAENVGWVDLYRLGMVVAGGEANPQAKKLAVVLAGARGLLETASAYGLDTGTAAGESASV